MLSNLPAVTIRRQDSSDTVQEDTPQRTAA